MNDSFYVTLFSNSSMDFYPDNRTSSYTVQLPRTLFLDGDWCVALSEFQYPHSFFNVQDFDNEIEIKTLFITQAIIDWTKTDNEPTVENMLEKFSYEWDKCIIAPGVYKSVEELVISVNTAIEKCVKVRTFFASDDTMTKLGAMPEPAEIGKKMILGVKLPTRLSLHCRTNLKYRK